MILLHFDFIFWKSSFILACYNWINIFVLGIGMESENDCSEGSKDGERTPKEDRDKDYNNQIQTLDHLDELELRVRVRVY